MEGAHYHVWMGVFPQGFNETGCVQGGWAIDIPQKLGTPPNHSDLKGVEPSQSKPLDDDVLVGLGWVFSIPVPPGRLAKQNKV